ncbi:acyl-CoA desaturase [Novosphingobium sp. Gsoil 351]|uniref:acyl-CoA desaturase n=1 Tax=Novosphingobium sp. Gsoil 351 TaxID=2675225 RepID=UPI0012B4F353|nr:acyl-CoA desaturase [Novosphingobium sp. Gsoil 351]QGN55141.1 acyl-CoA desaturase [Novosphingobium sp. Gsoil 351]
MVAPDTAYSNHEAESGADGRSALSLPGGPEPLVDRWQRSVWFGTTEAMSRRREHLFYAAVKQGGALVAIGWLLLQPTGWVEWSGFALFYVLNILSMSLGYHRYFTHKAFQTSRPMRYGLAALAQFGMYGSLRRWVADHRRHHALSDRPGDIHSPWVDGHGRPLSGKAGLKHSHLGWAYDDVVTNTDLYGKGVLGDPAIEWAHRTRYLWLVISVLVAPTLWAMAWGGGLAVSANTLIGTILVAGFLRAALALHAIAAVNSFGHVHGYRNFEVGDTARNNLVLGYLTLGEGWHNNHHAHARAASNHMRWWEIDMTGWVIAGLEKLGLIWDVRWPDFERPSGRSGRAPRRN